jgi:hypothetical protein
MREYDLPALPSYGKGYEFRKMAAEICNEALAKAARYGVANAEVGELSVFADAIKAAIASYVDVSAPTVTTRVRTNSTTATITFNAALDPSTSVPVSAFTIGARVLSGVVVVGSTIVITGVAITAADVVTYTPPASGPKVYGKDGNPIATFTGALA